MHNLAIGYREAGKLAEVEALFRDRLAEVRQRAANDPSKLAGPVNELVDALVQQHKYAEAEQLFDDVLTAPVLKQPASVGLLCARGSLRARRGEFAQAAGDLSKAREFSPDDHQIWHERAPLLVASDQLDLYRDQCRLSLERFGNTTNPVVAERIAKDCLMLPTSGVDLGIVAKMTDTAVTATNHSYIGWFQLVKGLAEYRRGHFAKAVEWMDKALSDEGNERERDVQACMVLAMAYDRLNQTEEARTAFAKGSEIEQTKLPKVES